MADDIRAQIVNENADRAREQGLDTLIPRIVNENADRFQETATAICMENIGRTNLQISEITGLQGLRCENYVGGVDFEHGLGGVGAGNSRGGPGVAR